jgi:branched-chain amino acid transport system substrate-binding protein
MSHAARERRRGTAAASLLALSLGACAAGPPSSRPADAVSRVEPLVLARPEAPRDGSLPIAAMFPTVGRYAQSGLQSLDGARLAVEDLNRRGGVHGRRVTLLEYPTGSYFLDAREAALLASRAGALAILGSNSSDLSMAIAEVAQAHRIVQVSNVSTAQDLTWDPVSGRDREYVFRVCATDVAMGSLLATFARETLHARRAAVLYEVGRPYSTRLARSFVEGFRGSAARGEIAEFFYLYLETDFRARLREVAAFEPDVVFMPGSFTDATLIATQAREVGIDTTLLGADGWSNPLLFKLGAPAAPSYFVDHCWPPPAFAERYRATFGRPAQGCRAVLAYDAMGVIEAGLRALAPLTAADLGPGVVETRVRLRDAVAGADARGLTGRLRFDRVGDRRTGVAVLRVTGSADGATVTRLQGYVEGR